MKRIKAIGPVTLRGVSVAFVSVVLLAGLAGSAAADEAKQDTVGPSSEVLRQCRRRAVDFLRNSQADDGSWTIPHAPGITGLITAALLQTSIPTDDPMVAKALKHIAGFVQEDGGVYDKKSQHRNYETCIALMVFSAANRDGKYDKRIAGAERFLRNLQWDQGEGVESSDTAFGGAGYGKHQRPDLSNTQFLIEALKTAGVKADDPAMQNALVFVSRCQNLESEHNTTPHAAKVDDGGMYYTAAAGGSSQAGTTPNGGLRSYGSMTYAGLKSMVYAGLKAEDRRVKAAFGWIQRFYTVEENPGLGQQGLFYYFQTFAKTLSALQVDYLEDAQGKRHDWRKDLTRQLAKLQKPNGSWVNTADRWYEGDPNLVTAYALIALSHCDPKPPQSPPASSE